MLMLIRCLKDIIVMRLGECEFAQNKNWYVIQCVAARVDVLCSYLNTQQGIFAFNPSWEFYRKDQGSWQIKPLYTSNYIFVLTDFDQGDFDYFVKSMGEVRNGIVRELRNKDEAYVSALRSDEIDMFEKLLDDQGILRPSDAHIINGKTVAYKGPLSYFNDRIKKVDRKQKVAYLDFSFMNRLTKAGVRISD